MSALYRARRWLAGVRLTPFGSDLLAAVVCVAAAVAGMLTLAALA